MYTFGYKTTVFIQNLHILVKFFGKNFIFRVKSTILFYFSAPNVHLWVQNYSFYPKFVHFSEYFLAKTSFLVLKVQLFWFFGTKCTFLGTKLQFLSKIYTF